MTATPAFSLAGPLDGRSPLLLASPHSGRYIPKAAARLLDAPPEALRAIEDAHVADLMAAAATAIGAPLLAATHSRVVIDLNRAEAEYDPAMFAGRLPFAARRTDRVRRGFGLVPRIAGSTRPIHRQPLPASILAERIDRLHRPWHEAIAAGLQRACAVHGYAVLIDCHSMPRLAGPRPAQLVVGDCHGASAHPALTAALVALFGKRGLTTVTNHPYAGGHSTSHHGRPAGNIHAVQLEFCRSLYMDPVTLQPTEGFATLSAIIHDVLTELAAGIGDILSAGAWDVAAE